MGTDDQRKNIETITRYIDLIICIFIEFWLIILLISQDRPWSTRRPYLFSFKSWASFLSYKSYKLNYWLLYSSSSGLAGLKYSKFLNAPYYSLIISWDIFNSAISFCSLLSASNPYSFIQLLNFIGGSIIWFCNLVKSISLKN